MHGRRRWCLGTTRCRWCTNIHIRCIIKPPSIKPEHIQPPYRLERQQGWYGRTVGCSCDVWREEAKVHTFLFIASNIKICKNVDVTIITKRGRGRVRYWWISINEVLACCLGMCWVHRGPLAAMIVACCGRKWTPWSGTFTCAQKEARPKIFALVCMVNAPQSLGLHPHTIYQITRKNKGCPMM